MQQEKYYYTIYGLYLCADRQLPELQPTLLPVSETNLVRIFTVDQSEKMPAQPQVNEPPYYTSPSQDENDPPILQVWRDQFYYHLAYRFGNHFLISRAGDAVWCNWPVDSDFGLVIAYLLGPVLGLVLRLREVLVLHASVVALDGQALAILGARGAGKSTLAAVLCQQGCQVLSDDIAALTWATDRRVLVQPGYPRLRLWPESADALFGPEHSLRPMVPGLLKIGSTTQRMDKRYMELDTEQPLFSSVPQPLRAIYILDWRDTHTEPRITSLQGVECLAILDAHSYLSYLIDQPLRTLQFAALTRLMECVVIRQLSPTNNLAVLPITAEAILKDIESLKKR